MDRAVDGKYVITGVHRIKGNICRAGACSRRNVVRIYQKPSSERKGDHEVVEGACVTIKIVLSSPLRTLPQSLRDSSLPEGAFEKFAAVLFGSRRLFFGASR